MEKTAKLIIGLKLYCVMVFEVIKQRVPWLFYPLEKWYRDNIPLKIRQKLKRYSLLMRIDKPVGTYLLLWPTLWALMLSSNGAPDLDVLIVFVLGTFLMRSAGCVINDIADRDLDAHVHRTKNRPMARRKVSVKEALLLFSFLVAIAFGLVLTMNALTIYLSFVAVGIATIYPFMKRHTYFPQIILGAAFSWAIPMAFAATQNQVPLTVWLIYLSTLLWVLAYDTFYGMVDRKYDIKIGIKSTAILFGDADLSIIALVQSFFLFGMLLVGERFNLSWPYYISLLIAASLISYQFWIARKRKPKECFDAFLNNNLVGLTLTIGILAHYLTIYFEIYWH